MSAQNSAGIQTLLDAEREAQKIVQKDRTKRVKDARTEAQREVEEYKKRKDAEFKKFEGQHSSGNKQAEDEADATAREKIAEIHEAGKKHGDKVVEDLLNGVMDVKPEELGHVIKDDYANIRARYQTPKYPIILAHGLLGFDELHLAGRLLPGLHYWRGIKEALAANNIEVITASVPPSASIEQRALKLGRDIAEKANGKSVNIVAHSMLKPENVDVKSLTTIATPHRGSAFADFILERIGDARLPKIYKALEFLHMESGAFSQLTRRYMEENFNPKTPDLPGVRYFSYGASVEPSWLSVFRHSHGVIERTEGPNDGLVSVASSKWGGEQGYRGTLLGVSHLDLINWTNRVRFIIWELTGHKRK
ncbi:MAG: hypothetical protein M1826_007105 [Phylliscum demangeonii]|nr:MAG: hypothetical protein M1826_007105 [Phylliscum demangeonii]